VSASARVDAQQQRLLACLREARGRAVTFAELHAAGIDFPAAVAGELELAGYAINRVAETGRPLGLRLLEPERTGLPGAPARRRWPWTRDAA
jgi:hypothetical protein